MAGNHDCCVLQGSELSAVDASWQAHLVLDELLQALHSPAKVIQVHTGGLHEQSLYVRFEPNKELLQLLHLQHRAHMTSA